MSIFIWTYVASPLVAQQSLSEEAITLQGIVLDGEWNVLPGTQVILMAYDKECSKRVITANQEGYYQFDGVSPGRHSLTITKDGFARVVAPTSAIKNSEPQVRHHFLLPEAKEKAAPLNPCPANDTAPHAAASSKKVAAQQSRLLRQVKPVYPDTAKTQGIEGDVIIEAVLNQQGRLSTLRPLFSPHPELTVAAERAIQQWRYSPTLMDGEPVEVIFTLTINFTLHQ